VALPCGKQRVIHGPAVNVPTDLKPACTLLPRLPSQTRIIPMKLKRKLSYKGNYMYQAVHTTRKGTCCLAVVEDEQPIV